MFVVLRVLGMFVWEIDCYGNHIYTDETIKNIWQITEYVVRSLLKQLIVIPWKKDKG